MKHIIISLTFLTTFIPIRAMDRDIIKTQEQYLHVQATDEAFIIKRESITYSDVLALQLLKGFGSRENPLQVPFTRQRFETQCITNPEIRTPVRTIIARM